MATCEVCGSELTQTRGRPRGTCSAACRQAAYRRRQNAEMAVLRAATAITPKPTPVRPDEPGARSLARPASQPESTPGTSATARRPPASTVRPAGWILTSPRVCPIASALQILGERWTLLVIREMNHGVHRFQEIARYTGASHDILADRLRKLERYGVIERRQYSEHPPRYEYHLTRDAGEELGPILQALAQWGRRWAVNS